MQGSKQKLIIENLLSSSDIFSRCVSIIRPEYFDPEYRRVVKFMLEYFGQYHSIPSLNIINAEFDSHKFTTHAITRDEYTYTCDEIEKFCQEEALCAAILESTDDVTSGDRVRFGKVLQRVQQAIAISLQRDMGIDMFYKPSELLRSMVDEIVYLPTGIKELDEALGGGLARRQFTMFSANSGVGKSVMLSNLGGNFGSGGKHVLQISLELPESMIVIRNAAILSGYSIKNWKETIPEMASKIEVCASSGGSFRIKRMPGGTDANDIRSYLKHYELEYGRRPDVLIIDYLDLMHPIGGIKQMSISEQDKAKSEEVAEILYDYDMVGISASQQNREALRLSTPDQAVVAGGISKVNTVDNYISLYMDPGMRIKGEMLAFYLKTRSSSAVGSSTMLKFNADNLQITGSSKGTSAAYVPDRKKQLHSELTSSGQIETDASPDALINLMNTFNI